MRPSSSMPTPSRTVAPSRIGTTNACTPCEMPPTSSCANTTASWACWRRVADVVLAGLLAVRGDDELLGRDVVRRHRAERLHVGPVAGLGHREAAHQLPGDQVAQVGVVVPLRAELQDRATEEPELHADLDQHREVAVSERLEGRDGSPDVATPAVLLGKAHAGLSGGRHLDDDVANPLPEVVDVQVLGLVEHGGVRREVGADQLADLGVLPVEQRRQGRHLDDGLLVAGRAGGNGGVGGHVRGLPTGPGPQAVIWTAPDVRAVRRSWA